MKRITFAIATLVTFGTTACSTAPVTPKNALKDALLNSHVAVTPITNPAQLSERTKAQAIGNMVVSSVVSSAVGSGIPAKNAQEMQQNMEVLQSFNQNLQQALPNSYTVADGRGADLALAKKLSDYLANQAQPSASSGRELSITVSAPLWELAYTSLLLSQDYALNYQLRITLSEQKADKAQALKTVYCDATAPDKMPLDNWKADHYKAVDASAEKIVTTCFNQFLTETGLN